MRIEADSSSCVVAVDAGGTSVRALALALDGRCLGLSRMDGGNPLVVGGSQVARGVAAAVAAAVAEGGADPSEVGGIVVAMTGHMPDGDLGYLGECLKELGVTAFPTLVPDILATFFSGRDAGEGYALVAGTGAAAIRVERSAIAAAADGLGHLLGDVGSGFWIGQGVVRAALAGLDGIGPQTKLTELLQAELPRRTTWPLHSRAEGLIAMVEALHARPARDLARFAKLAFAAAGDPVADRLVSRAADGLARTLAAVATEPWPAVFSGGILAAYPRLAQMVIVRAPKLGPVVVVPDGLAGAAAMALREALGRSIPDTLGRINQTLAPLRERHRAANRETKVKAA
ncbi:MAG: hypothetical protein LBD70_01085 [Bifidobacteriaceae bacterium]|jgi:N-acetylglucosamine kinase-like BadF-type ATPase|nr:hypothetical protein [Bifidobacteriaceae bacterium]